MTVVAVFCDPPREGLVLPALPESTPLSAAEAADLYRAALMDAVRAAARSGGDPLVNYRPPDLLPEVHRGGPDPEAELTELAAQAVADADDAEEPRLEVQVGGSPAARVGNTVTHLLREEGAASAAILRPTAPLVGRTVVDSAAMKLRRSSVVLGPATGGDAYYAGFSDPLDFEGALADPEIETLVDRASEADLAANFLAPYPTIETGRDLATTVSVINARRRADRNVPPFTAGVVEDLGLSVREEDGEPRVVVA